MKAIFISFNQAYYEAIVSIMDRNNLKGFTQGNGSARASGLRLEYRENHLT